MNRFFASLRMTFEYQFFRCLESIFLGDDEMSIYQKIRSFVLPPRFQDEKQNLVAGIFTTTAIATLIILCFWLMYQIPAGQVRLLPAIALLAIMTVISIVFSRRGFLHLSASLLLWS